MARATKPGTRLHYLEVQLEEERAAFHAAQVAEREAREETDELHAENERLRETIAEWQEIHGTFTGAVHAACQTEIERLRAALLKIADDSSHADQYVRWAQAALDRPKCR